MTKGLPKETSIFEKRTMQDIYEEVRNLYQRYPQPWVIGYSGGKDSTAVVQLVWKAVEGLRPEERLKPVFVIASDTKVETPVIVEYINTTLHLLNKAAKAQGMPFQADKVMPTLNNSFWVNLIGRGYPAPTSHFRWCTDRMKIQPANRFIEGKVTQYGEVIMVLGVRKAESATRMQLMNTYQIKSHLLRRHTSLRGAYVYAPIADFSTDDVWMYLLQVPSPWGGNNDNGASHVVGRKMVLWGITPHGLAFAWDLDEAMEERASFELGKTHPAYVEHCVSVQRLRLQAQACGWQQWTPGRLLMGQKLEKVPDGQAIDPNGAHVAVEFEKEIKTPKRYQAILGTYLVALRAGRWQRVEYVCPSADMAARLKRSFYALTEVVYKGQKAQVVHERHLDNRVTFSGIEDWPISRAV